MPNIYLIYWARLTDFPPSAPCLTMDNVNTTYLMLWFILTRPGLVVTNEKGYQFKYDEDKACILYHNPESLVCKGWYVAKGAMQYAAKYRMASVNTYDWTIAPYSEEDMARTLYEQGLTWWRP